MPIYEYQCADCDEHLELIQKVGEGRKRKCPECGGKLEKLISRTSFQLKGGGWYDQGYTKAGGSTKSTAKKSPKKSKTKAKPASKDKKN